MICLVSLQQTQEMPLVQVSPAHGLESHCTSLIVSTLRPRSLYLHYVRLTRCGFCGHLHDDCGAVVWRESVVIGETSLGAQEVQEVVQQLGSEYKGTAYHLLERNCNHFSNELCMKLTGKPAPSWVCPAIRQCLLTPDFLMSAHAAVS